MSESISVCGTDCGACSFFGGLCRGCNECQGRVFHAPAGCACPIYACVREKKGLRNCAQCPDLPCSLWQSTRDPSFTDEQFAANIAGRVENLRKRMTNRELADFVSAQLAPLPEVRRIPMMGGFIFYYRERIFGGVYGLHGQERPGSVALHARHHCRAALRWREAYAARPDSRRFRKAPRHGAGNVGRAAGTSAEKAERLTAFGKHSGKSAKKVRQKGKKPPKTLGLIVTSNYALFAASGF